MNKLLTSPSYFTSLCDIVNPFLKDGAVKLINPDWPKLISTADFTHVLPELYHGLVRHNLFNDAPPETQQLLSEVYEYLLLRSNLIKKQCDEITNALNIQGITPIWLKGATLLHLNNWQKSIRIMNDIDLWVPGKEKQLVAINVLNELGYIKKQEHELWEESHHFSPFHHPKRVATVELHKHIIRPALSPLLPNEDCLNSVQYEQNGELRYGILSIQNRIAHSFIQCSLMASPNIETGFIRLMKIVDMLRLMEKANTRNLPENMVKTLKQNQQWNDCAANVMQLVAQHFPVQNTFAQNIEYQQKVYQLLSGEKQPETVARQFAIFRLPATPFKTLLQNPRMIVNGLIARFKLLITGKF